MKARCSLSAAPPCPPSVFSQYSTFGAFSTPASSSNDATIFLACPGCTRSSRVDVVKSVRGHFQLESLVMSDKRGGGGGGTIPATWMAPYEKDHADQDSTHQEHGNVRKCHADDNKLAKKLKADASKATSRRGLRRGMGSRVQGRRRRMQRQRKER